MAFDSLTYWGSWHSFVEADSSYAPNAGLVVECQTVLEKWAQSRAPETFWTSLYAQYSITELLLTMEIGGSTDYHYWTGLIARTCTGVQAISCELNQPGNLRAELISEKTLQLVWQKLNEEYRIGALQSTFCTNIVDGGIVSIVVYSGNGKHQLVSNCFLADTASVERSVVEYLNGLFDIDRLWDMR